MFMHENKKVNNSNESNINQGRHNFSKTERAVQKLGGGTLKML